MKHIETTYFNTRNVVQREQRRALLGVIGAIGFWLALILVMLNAIVG